MTKLIDGARRSVAATILLAGSILYIGSFWFTFLQICRPMIVNNLLTPSCSPWTVSELIPFILGSLLFVLPDFSEVAVANVLTLKREVKANKAEIDAAASKIEAIELNVSAQLANLTSTQNVSQQLILSSDLIGLPETILKKSHQLVSTVDAATTEGLTAPLDKSSSDLTIQLLAVWRDLGAAANRARVAARDDSAETETSRAVVSWFRLFEDEIAKVRAVRNSVAHAEPVDHATLANAVAAARELQGLLRNAELNASARQ